MTQTKNRKTKKKEDKFTFKNEVDKINDFAQENAKTIIPVPN